MKFLTILAFLCALALAPTTQAATVTKLSDQTALVTIEFTFTDAFADFEIPAFTDHTITETDRVDQIGFAIDTPDQQQMTDLSVTSMILSTQPLSNTRYTLPRGETGEFKLIALVTFPDQYPGEMSARLRQIFPCASTNTSLTRAWLRVVRRTN
jgi:hypothetical protein